MPLCSVQLHQKDFTFLAIALLIELLFSNTKQHSMFFGLFFIYKVFVLFVFERESTQEIKFFPRVKVCCKTQENYSTQSTCSSLHRFKKTKKSRNANFSATWLGAISPPFPPLPPRVGETREGSGGMRESGGGGGEKIDNYL